MNRKKGWEKLDLDSKLFNFGVARLSDNFNPAKLGTTLKRLARQGFRCIFWEVDPGNKKANNEAAKHKGFLADKKTTLFISILSFKPKLSPLKKIKIEEYQDDEPTADLEELAILSGKFSRFASDPKIGRKNFEKMYREWIKNSVNKTKADKVLIARQGREIIGLVTLGEKNGRGDIGLIAVKSMMQGRGIGSRLIESALQFFKINNLDSVQVVTQGNNKAALAFYQKSGFRIENMKNFYHFWL